MNDRVARIQKLTSTYRLNELNTSIVAESSGLEKKNIWVNIESYNNLKKEAGQLEKKAYCSSHHQAIFEKQGAKGGKVDKTFLTV